MSATKKSQRQSAAARKRQQARQRQLIVLASFAIALIGLGLLLLSAGGDTSGSPDFTANTLSGETVQLADYRGHVVMINFWATWCPPCRAEMPTIQQAYNQYHAQGLEILAINNGEQPGTIQPFVDNLALAFPVVLDTSRRLQNHFGIMSYPTSLFLNADGEIYATHTGMLNASQLTTYIENGLAGGDMS